MQKQTPHKFGLFHQLQKFLDSMPAFVRQAWSNGWKEIVHHPTGYTTMDSCGCCFDDWAPGWYGRSPQGKWKFICDSDGKHRTSAIVDSHSIVGCC